jgi:hypothetical protein
MSTKTELEKVINFCKEKLQTSTSSQSGVYTQIIDFCNELTNYRQPLCLTVKYALANDFRSMVENIANCKVQNVIEIKSGELLQYWIDCPKEKENEISDMAFMTWIRNPIFQKYYHNTKAFQEIAKEYVAERLKGDA